MNHPNTLCKNMMNAATDAPTATSAAAALSVLVDNALCLPGRVEGSGFRVKGKGCRV
jgi:hypothetical protein